MFKRFIASFILLAACSADAGVITLEPSQVYNVQCADDVVLFSNASIANLPDAKICPGKRIVLKKTDLSSGLALIYPASGQLIDYMPQLKLQISGDGAVVFSDGTHWRIETQYQKNRPYSHRTVTYGSSGGSHSVDICRDNAEFIRVWANETPSGMGIYLPPANQGCNPSNPYVNTAVLWIMNVSSDLSKPVSIWPSYGNTINGSGAPVFLKLRYEGVMLYTDGAEWFILEWVNPAAGPARSW